jgi:hypothetical protein
MTAKQDTALVGVVALAVLETYRRSFKYNNLMLNISEI